MWREDDKKKKKYLKNIPKKQIKKLKGSFCSGYLLTIKKKKKKQKKKSYLSGYLLWAEYLYSLKNSYIEY